MTTLVAEFVHVEKTYRTPLRPARTIPALRDVSFGIERGEVFALLGPNQAGKSTLLKILLGLCQPSRGRVYRLDLPASNRRTLSRVGYMHENQAFPEYLSATGLLEFYGRLTYLPADILRTRIPELLDRVGLADRAGEPISRFSKGMVQRLALAQALLGDPDLLVLDEPMEGLDHHARLLLKEIILQQKASGHTVLIVSHALGEVARLCDRLAVLVRGRLACLSTLNALLGDGGLAEPRSFEEAIGAIYEARGSVPS